MAVLLKVEYLNRQNGKILTDTHRAKKKLRDKPSTPSPCVYTSSSSELGWFLGIFLGFGWGVYKLLDSRTPPAALETATARLHLLPGNIATGRDLRGTPFFPGQGVYGCQDLRLNWVSARSGVLKRLEELSSQHLWSLEGRPRSTS